MHLLIAKKLILNDFANVVVKTRGSHLFSLTSSGRSRRYYFYCHALQHHSVRNEAHFFVYQLDQDQEHCFCFTGFCFEKLEISFRI